MNKLICGDNLEELAKLPKESVDLDGMWGQTNTTDDRYWILDTSAKYGITYEKIAAFSN